MIKKWQALLRSPALDYSTKEGKRTWWAAAFILALLTWFPLFFNQFLMWDDDFNLYQNPILLNGHWQDFWRTPYMGFYIPLTYTVWDIVASTFGLGSSLPFEILNFLFHVINSVLAYFYVKVLLEQVSADDPETDNRKAKTNKKTRDEFERLQEVRAQRMNWAAFVAGLVYLVHPLQVGAVAWHSGFRDLMSHFWTLILVNILLRDQSRRAIGWSFILFCLSLLSKPSSVAMPIVLLFTIFFLPKIKRRPLYIFILLSLPIGLYFSIWTRDIQSQYMIGLQTAKVADRPLIILDSYGFYIRQFFGGAPLSGDYGRTPPHVLQWKMWEETIPWLVGFLILVPALLWKRWRELLLFGALWAIPLAPVCGIVPFNFQRISTVADHYFIPSMPAFCFLIALLIFRPPKWTREKSLAWLILPVILVWATMTQRRIPDWHDSETFFHSILRTNSYSHSANNYLGFFAFQRQDYPAAEKFFRQAVDSLHVSAISSGNLGYALLRQNKHREAADLLAPYFHDPEFFSQNMVHRHVIAVNYLAYGLALANLGAFRPAFDAICEVFKYEPQPSDRKDATETLAKLRAQLNPGNPSAVVCPETPPPPAAPQPAPVW